MHVFLAQDSSVVDALPAIFVFLAPGHLVGIVALLLLGFRSQRRLGRRLGLAAVGIGAFLLLYCWTHIPAFGGLPSLIAGSPILVGSITVLFASHEKPQPRGFEVLPTLGDDPDSESKEDQISDDG